MLSLTAGDGSALGSLTFAAIQRATDTAHFSIRVTNTGVTDVAGGYLEILTEQTPSMLDWISSGAPPVDEWWGRFQVTSTGGSTPGQERLNDSIQSMGHLAVADLPPIKAGNWVIGDFWLRQPANSAGGSAVNIRLVVAGDEAARGVPDGVAASVWGVISGVNLIRSFLISGAAITATGTPDDQVHVAARAWLIGGVSYSDGTQDITFNQNDSVPSALTAGQGYWATISQGVTSTPTVTKGIRGTTPVKPAVPSGELLLAFVLVSYQADASDIASGDIDQSLLAYGRLLGIAPATGLSMVIHAGESLAGGFQQFHALPQTVTLVGTATNRVWMEYTGAVTVTQTAAPPSPAAILLWTAVTSGSAVTSLTDNRVFVPMPATGVAAHASSHASVGTDPVSPASIGAATASHAHAEADVTGLAADLALKAPLAAPAFTGNPTATTQSAGDNSTKVATTAFVQAAVDGPRPAIRNTTSKVTGDSPYTVVDNDYTIFANTASGDLTIKLPAAPQQGRVVEIKNVNGGVHALTLDGNGKNIDGSATETTTTNNRSYTLHYDATFDWAIV